MPRKYPAAKTRKASCYASLEKENRAEYARRARMTVAERFDEFAVIQKRAFGKAWTATPIVKVATMEKIDW
jgi:hypothetical protein